MLTPTINSNNHDHGSLMSLSPNSVQHVFDLEIQGTRFILKIDEINLNWERTISPFWIAYHQQLVLLLSTAIRYSRFGSLFVDIQFLPISGLHGTNMQTRMDKNICPWWNGQCLFEALDALEVPPRDPHGPFRMPIIDKFKDLGTVVMGKVESGSVREGNNLVIMPNKVQVKVLAIYCDEDKVRNAGPGENLRVRLSGIEEEDILSGFVLSSIAGYKAVLHIHSVVEECEIIELMQQIDPKTRKPMKKKVLFVKNGAVVICRIQCFSEEINPSKKAAATLGFISLPVAPKPATEKKETWKGGQAKGTAAPRCSMSSRQSLKFK
ncbi:hypothetical protein E3N88_00444 [Mikania micrantha]|uniref:Translation elongation factor EFTu-like domain-containing protein n=1 Tax=Mikania micrantha TaxID=192012 RepID=A0A5N6Q098_9ASTR|nr:hypothetical protein E3N88_00444 [Mikania micrantha]